MRIFAILLGFLLLMAHGSGVWAASQKAAALRQAQGLTVFTPPENFVAEEADPTCIFGTVRDFATSRQCPTTWLIEADVKNRPVGPGSPDKPREYTLYLEEDCPDRVIYYVFVDQSGMTPEQWLEWRRLFHKSKAAPQFGKAKSNLEQACQQGCGVSGELRYLQKDGELLQKSPEEYLRVELKFAPIYDLNQQKKISK